MGAALQSAALFLACATAAVNAAAAPCGTAVIPTGIGLGSPASLTSLIPLVGQNGANLQGSVLLYRPLVWPDRNAAQDPAQSLAQNIAVLDNRTRFRVTLKPWTWSDGAPLTSSDVVFGWNELHQLGTDFAYYGQGGVPGRVASVQAVSPTQVDFRLTQPTNPAWFELNGLSVVFPLPEHAWRGLTAEQLWRRQTDPRLVRVVDGPFRLTDFRLDRYAAFAPNPRYGGAPSHVARLVLTFLEGDAPLHAVQAGDADAAVIPNQLWNRLKPRPGFHGVTLPEPYGYWALTPNMRNPADAFFRDARVRRALAQAVNQQDIIGVVFRGLGHENHLPVPVAAPAWRSQGAGADLGYDPARAAAGLRAAGWRPGPDGVLVQAGQRLAFTLVSGAPSDDAAEIQALLLVQRDLRRVGVDMRLRRIGFEQLLATIADPAAWDAALVPQTAAPLPDGSGYLDTGGGSNTGGYSDAAMDSLIAASNSAEGAGALFAYEDYAAAQAPWIILPQGELPLLVANRLHGVAAFSSPLGYWTPEALWVEDGTCHAPGAETLR